jgi:hypothetical protein
MGPRNVTVTIKTKRRILVLSASAILALAAGLLVAKKSDLFYTRADAKADLNAVRTAAEEHDAFSRIASRARVVFALYDSAGEQLGISTSDWPKRAHSIRFYQFGNPPLEHIILDRKNVHTLTRE